MSFLIQQFLLQESKDKLIDQLGNLSAHEKELVKDFLNKHPNYESKIDWNRATSLKNPLYYNDFEVIFGEQENSNSNTKRKIKNGDISALWNNRKEAQIMLVKDHLIYVAPLSYKEAVFMNSFDCYGIGAKWCIGYSKDSHYWIKYLKENCMFVMKYNSFRKTKDMLQIEYTDRGRWIIKLWDQTDNSYWDSTTDGLDGLEEMTGLTLKEANEMFDKLADTYDSKNIVGSSGIDINEFKDASSYVIKYQVMDYIEALVSEEKITKETLPQQLDRYFELAESTILKLVFEENLGIDYSLTNKQLYRESKGWSSDSLEEDLKNQFKFIVSKMITF